MICSCSRYIVGGNDWQLPKHWITSFPLALPIPEPQLDLQALHNKLYPELPPGRPSARRIAFYSI